MPLASSVLTVLRAQAEAPCAQDAAGRIARSSPRGPWPAASTAARPRVALAWVVSLSVHTAALAVLGWSLPSRSPMRWISVAPGQASIALVASPAAEIVSEPPLPEWRQPTDGPPDAIRPPGPQTETAVRREAPQRAPVEWAESACAELPVGQHPEVPLPIRTPRRDAADALPGLPIPTGASPPRAEDARRAVELPPSTAPARPSVASLDAQGAEEPSPAVLHNPAPEYPAAALRARQTGRVVLLVGVHSDGSVAWARLSQSSGVSALDQAALQVIRRWRFSAAEPASPIRTIRVPFRFVLDE